MGGAIYDRQYYLEKIRGFYKSDLIKVITGVRRCGKSCFMQSVMNDLRAQGIAEKDIIYLDLDARKYRGITTPDKLESAIEAFICDADFKYIFIDEIQNVPGFEAVINGFRTDGNCSLFITGSNSYMLSGELVTKLTGRYVEIEMFPLNFREYLEMKRFFGKETKSNAEEFVQYVRGGGFPKTVEFDSAQDRQLYTQNVIEQIIAKDIKRYRKIRNWSMFERVMNYLFNNFGAPVSLKNIVAYFKEQEQCAIRTETLNKYIEILENAKLLYKCPRFDIKSRRALQNEQKYYLADLSIYFARNTDARINYGPALENLLYIYLKSRGYSLSVGKVGKLECDFIVRKELDYCYIQVAMTIADKKTEDREYLAFENIRDNYPKYLFTLDPLLQSRDGIIHKNLADFIAKGEDL